MGLRDILLATYIGGATLFSTSQAVASGFTDPIAASSIATTAAVDKDYRKYLDSIDGDYELKSRDGKGGSAGADVKLWVNGKNKGKYVIRLRGNGLILSEYKQESKGAIVGTNLVADTMEVRVDAGYFGVHQENHSFNGSNVTVVVNSELDPKPNVSVPQPATHVNDLLTIFVDQGYNVKKGFPLQTYSTITNGKVGTMTFTQDSRNTRKYFLSVKAGKQEMFDSSSFIVYTGKGRIQEYKVKKATGASVHLKLQ